MSRDMPESDWKVFRQLHAVALERFCERVLAEVSHVLGDCKQSSHARFLSLYKLIEKRDDELANAFNDLRRSTALRQLAIIRHHELLTEEEMARFSPQTYEAVRGFLEFFRD